MLKSILHCLLLFFSGFLYGQNSICVQIKDAKYESPLAFALVTDTSFSKGGQTDVDGQIYLPLKTNECFFITLYGYSDKKCCWKGENPWIINLESDPLTLNELIIYVKDDPALKVVKNCIEQSKKNTPELHIDFEFEQYTKMLVDAEINEETALKKALEKRGLMISETVSLYQHKAPDLKKEAILANRLSGFEFPQFTLIGTQLQSFSPYEPDFQIFDQVFISPLGPRAMDRYDYRMMDTTVIGMDTTFVISFFPKKRFQNNGLLGILHISPPSYALIQLAAEPFEKESSFYIKIQQEFELVNGYYFPVNLNSFYKMGNTQPYVFGEIQSKIYNIKERKFDSKDFDAIVLDFPESANTIKKEEWNQIRYTPLTERELNTYHFTDSLGKAEHFENRVNRWTSFFQGEIMLGKINWNIAQLYRLNKFEGSRLGLSLNTNSRFNTHWQLEGAAAYGTKDKQFKYFSGISWKSSNQQIKFRLSYIDDVVESGNHNLPAYRKNLNTQIYEFFISKMDYVKGPQFELELPITNNIKLQYKEALLLKTPNPLLVKMNDYQISTNRIMLRWSPGEKKKRVLGKEIILSGYWPTFKYGFSHLIINQSDPFYRHQIEIEKTFHSVYFGDVKCNFNLGKTIKQAPLNELTSLRGSLNDGSIINISIPESFETALNNKLYARSYAHFHMRYRWRTPLYQSESSEPKLTFVFNAAWGKLDLTDAKPEYVRDYSNGYFETGIAINDLLKSKTGGTGIGFFHAIGPSYLDAEKNKLVVKLTTNFLF